MFMHALPGIVDGAINTSQVGGWIRCGVWRRSCRLSSSPMLEAATSSRNQCINVAPSVVRQVEICTFVNRLKLMHRCWITLSILGHTDATTKFYSGNPFSQRSSISGLPDLSGDGSGEGKSGPSNGSSPDLGPDVQKVRSWSGVRSGP